MVSGLIYRFSGRAALHRGRVAKRSCIVSVESHGPGPDGAGPSQLDRYARSVFCMVRLAGGGRPPGGPSWAILSHGLPGGRALPEGAFHLTTPYGGRVPSPPCACLAQGFAFMPRSFRTAGRGLPGRLVRQASPSSQKISVPPSSVPSVFRAAGPFPYGNALSNRHSFRLFAPRVREAPPPSDTLTFFAHLPAPFHAWAALRGASPVCARGGPNPRFHIPARGAWWGEASPPSRSCRFSRPPAPFHTGSPGTARPTRGLAIQSRGTKSRSGREEGAQTGDAPGFARSAGPPAGPGFSNDWKKVFQWLEKLARVFQ